MTGYEFTRKPRIPRALPQQHSGYVRARLGKRRLGDSCWLDSTTGAQVCGAGDPTGQSSCVVTAPYYQPAGSMVAPDQTTWTFAKSGNQIIATPKSKNNRTYSFLHHAGYMDVYKLSGGSGCSGFSCAYLTVDKYGNLAFASSAPAQSEVGCSNVTTAYTTSTGIQTVQSTPVTTYVPQSNSNAIVPTTAGTGYVSTSTQVQEKSSSFLGSIPTWALVAGGVGGGVLLMKVLKKR